MSGFNVIGGGRWVLEAAINDVLNLADALDRLRLPASGHDQGPLVRALQHLRDNAHALVVDPPQLLAAVDATYAAFTDAGEAAPVVGAMLTIATNWRAGEPPGSAGYGPEIRRAQTQRANNAATFERMVRQFALRECGYAVTGMDLDNYDRAIETLDAITYVFDLVEQDSADAGDDRTFSALAELRGAITRMILGRAADLAALITYRSLATPNSLTLSWRLYQDSDREPEICDRLNARNPAFLPRTGRVLAA